ncbi:MAG TPA: polysaccharide biosynthesis tyrosine autokinase [Phycisphaerae bacterium]|nr:polysaccharide biosynthesis tyrosine autokinase [Phycisphaerae bacterium]
MPVRAAARTSHGAAALSLSDVIRILKQRIFLIIFIIILFVGATAGATFWLAKNRPLYRSSAAVMVESPFPKNPMDFGETATPAELMNRFVSDQMFIVTDEGLLRDALNDPDIRNTSWYGSEPDKNALLQELKSDLNVRQSTNSSIFIVSFATKAVDDAPKIVNTIVRRYLDRVTKLSKEKYANELEKFGLQEASLKSQLQQIRSSKETFITSQLGTPGLASNLNVTGEVWRALAMEAAALESQALQLKAGFDNLKGLDPSEITLSPQMMLMIDQDVQVAGLKSTLITLRQNQLTIMEKVGLNHPSALQIKNQMDSVQKLLDDVMAQKREEARQYQISSAENGYLNALQAQIGLQDRADQAKAEQRDVDRKLGQYQTLEEEQRLTEDKYKQVSEQINNLQLIMKDQTVVRVHSISQAVQALRRDFPRWGINMTIGTILGVVLGVGLAILLEVIDTSIRTTRDIVHHVHIPILGTVPDVDDEEIPIEPVEMAAHVAPRSMIAEAFRNIRTNLALSSPAERQRALVVTSSRPEEGKTAVAINLAISIAQNNRRVLLVDANFHRPALRNFFPNARPEGLSNYLIGQKSLAELVTGTDLPNLDVLSSGPIPPNPAELLAGSYLRNLVREAEQAYDQIIVDGPPALLVTDALVLAGALDGVVLVCRAKSVSRGVVQRARDQLERANIRIFGGVLNAARVTRGGYFREQMRSYYEYQPAEALQSLGRPALTTDEQADQPEAKPGKTDQG